MIAPLTTEERERFASWLEWEAKTDSLLLDELEKVSPQLAAPRRTDVGAYLLVANRLRAIENYSV